MANAFNVKGVPLPCSKRYWALVLRGHSLLLLLFLSAAFAFPAEQQDAEAAEPVAAPSFPRPLRQAREPSPAALPVTPPFYLTSPPLRVPSFVSSPEVMEQPLVQYYLKQFTSSGGLAWLNAVMERGACFVPFIKNEIAERGLPPEMVYLPVIESGWLTTAVSRSGAAGLWQFMKNSIGPFDMKVNDWLDERMDFWKSTQGALQKIKDNHKALGNWPLALAAYNAGLGALTKAVKETGERDYWVLSAKKKLKNETIHYVPKLIAVSCILSNPRYFGADFRWDKEVRWTRLPVERPVDLSLLAKETGLDMNLLKKANSELRHNMTPANSGYMLKLPEEDAAKTAEVLARKDLPLIAFYRYTIQSGDTLFALAPHYGISVETILNANPGIQPQFLKPGKTLLIPALKEVSPYTRPGRSGEKLVFNGTHLVKKGETLWSIALAYGVDPEDLAEANGMALNGILHEGKSLKTPIKE